MRGRSTGALALPVGAAGAACRGLSLRPRPIVFVFGGSSLAVSAAGAGPALRGRWGEREGRNVYPLASCVVLVLGVRGCLSGGRCSRAWEREMTMADVVSVSSRCLFGKYGRGRKRHFAISALLRFLLLVLDVWYLVMTPRVPGYL